MKEKCSVLGCDRDARYKALKMCQKHYFRNFRNGTTKLLSEIKKECGGVVRQTRLTMPGKGYQFLYEPDHKLATKQGYVYEHRKVVYSVYGDSLKSCAICGRDVNWSNVHIDHIDKDVKNNKAENLRPLCRVCNTRRDKKPEHESKHAHAISFNGETKTPAEWARDERVNVAAQTIITRKKSGMSDFDALFSKKITHNGNVKKK